MQIAVPIARLLIEEASEHFTENIDSFLSGEADELSNLIPNGSVLNSLKSYARKFIYVSEEAQRIEIAGFTIVHELLNHFGKLLKMSTSDFKYFI